MTNASLSRNSGRHSQQYGDETDPRIDGWLVMQRSVHPLATVRSSTQTRNLVLVVFKVELVVISQLQTATQRQVRHDV